jgi:general stress protein CsbA
MYIAVMLFGIPSMIVASKKGFADSRWLITFGLLGFIIVCCLPSAKAQGISHDKSRARRNKANVVGGWLCGINVFVFAVGTLVFLFGRTFNSQFPH